MATAAKKRASKPAPKQFSSAPGKIGRPRTTVADLPDDWEATIRDLAQNGAGRVEWQCALGIHNSAYATLLEDDADFRATIMQCKLLCQAWWEKIGREGAAGARDVNAGVWSFNMKNRFKWRDALVSEAREATASAAQPKTITRTVLPAVKHTPTNFDAPSSQGVVED